MAIFARVGLVSNCIKAVLQTQWRTLKSGVTLQWDKGARRSLLNWRRVMYARSTPVLMCHWISATWLFLREAARRISQEEWWDVQGENQLLCGRPFILQVPHSHSRSIQCWHALVCGIKWPIGAVSGRLKKPCQSHLILSRASHIPKALLISINICSSAVDTHAGALMHNSHAICASDNVTVLYSTYTLPVNGVIGNQYAECTAINTKTDVVMVW